MLPVPARPPEPSIASLRNSPGDGESLAMYWAFYWAVAAAQLARWLPHRPSRILDVSGGQSRSGAQAAAAGHTVLEVRDPDLAAPENPPVNGNGHRRPPAPRPRGGHPPGTLRQVIADTGSLAFLTDACVDAVIAEDRALSRHLATESTIAEIARVLRPGGRVLLSVDSLTLGMALLAEQNYWAHLSDVPSAEVVLVPWPDGTITRCFWADQLRELLTEVGLEVEWIRPRTVLSPSTVEHVLNASPGDLTRLVRTELSAPLRDESLGIHLLASARRI
ncbi:class I SAM-dependent methyltransferase [Spirillospora sp. NPDC048911]|uniref:class I SAM-dependent methyltransferase n=1 Tax=Spirillospora sp. NPDC048911 TaxID=3364527 RepID=UPI0037143E12